MRRDEDWDLDLGLGHKLAWTTWEPDPVLNPQWASLPPIEEGTHCGAILQHPTGPKGGSPWGEMCQSGINFDVPRIRAAPEAFDNRAVWQVQCWDPLTVSPSILCLLCDDHGFIREGRWVPA